MRNVIAGTIVVVLMFMSSCGNADSVEDEFYKKKVIRNMHDASLWIIEDGINSFYAGGKEAMHRKLVDSWGVSFWADPSVDTNRYLARFIIHARGIAYDIHNVYRKKVDGKFYEFWLVKVTSKDWSGEKEREVFYITSSDDSNGPREIVKESDQFIETYSVGAQEINLPIDNLQLLYDLEAWKYPDNYRNSDIKNKKVYMDSEGNISLE